MSLHLSGSSTPVTSTLMLFSKDASKLLICSLLGSSLHSCFGCLICIADVLFLKVCIQLVCHSADKSLHKKRSRSGPFAIGVKSWKTHISNCQLAAESLWGDPVLSLALVSLFFFFVFGLRIFTLSAKHFESLSVGSFLTVAYFLLCFLCFHWPIVLKLQKWNYRSQLRCQLSFSFLLMAVGWPQITRERRKQTNKKNPNKIEKEWAFKLWTCRLFAEFALYPCSANIFSNRWYWCFAWQQ